jgi:hypothetical protein
MVQNTLQQKGGTAAVCDHLEEGIIKNEPKDTYGLVFANLSRTG